MGSKSTYVRASIGGIEGRALKEGDQLQIGIPSSVATCMIEKLLDEKRIYTQWGVCRHILPKYSRYPVIRIITDFEWNEFSKESQASFFTKEYKVSPYADRMGYRLKGEHLKRIEDYEVLSSAVTFGTVQVPPGGQPIILMADRQTTGGYPRIGNVISVDLPILAQLKPSDYVTFVQTSMEEAAALYIEQERNVRLLQKFINLQE